MTERIAGMDVERRGSGPPLLLVHGLGHRWQAWLPLLDDLATDHEVVAVDLPGFGTSPALDGIEPTIANLADALVAVLDELGWDQPELCGNSLGGWLALELARRSRARSVVALSPAGLWRTKNPPRRARVLFTLWRTASRALGPLVGLLRFSLVRTFAELGLFGRPWRIPGSVAVADTRNLAACNFSATMRALHGDRFTGGQDIAAPIAIVRGNLDPLIGKRQLRLDELPPGTELAALSGCGHIPTWDDPESCTRAIRRVARRVEAG